MKELLEKYQSRIDELEGQSVFTEHQEQEREMLLSHYRNFLADLSVVENTLDEAKKSLSEIVECAGAANRSAFNQLKDAVNGCQEIAETALEKWGGKE